MDKKVIHTVDKIASDVIELGKKIFASLSSLTRNTSLLRL